MSKRRTRKQRRNPAHRHYQEWRAPNVHTVPYPVYEPYRFEDGAVTELDALDSNYLRLQCFGCGGYYDVENGVMNTANHIDLTCPHCKEINSVVNMKREA